jgi:hypothetical protein
MWLFQWVFNMTYKPPVNMHELERQIYELHELISWLIGRSPHEITDISRTFDGSEQLRSPWIANSVLHPEMPDYKVLMLLF